MGEGGQEREKERGESYVRGLIVVAQCERKWEDENYERRNTLKELLLMLWDFS